MNTFDLKFGTPEQGWMKIELCSQLAEIELLVSDVPCDSLRGLVKALLSLSEGSGEETVQWSLEPEYADWIFTRKGNNVEFTVCIPSGTPPKFICDCEAKELIHRLYRRLSDLEANSLWRDADVRERIWSWDFPSKVMSDLKEAVKKT